MANGDDEADETDKADETDEAKPGKSDSSASRKRPRQDEEGMHFLALVHHDQRCYH